jgi:Berberine and berberine like
LTSCPGLGFGAVTRFTLRLGSIGPVLVRSAVYPAEAAAEAMRACAAFAAGLDDDLHLLYGLRRAAPGGPVLGVTVVCSAADPASAEQCRALFGAMPTGSIDIEYLRGALLRGGTSESAFPQREAPFMVTVSGSWDDPGLDRDGIAWAREAIGSLSAWEHPGAYANYISQREGAQQALAMYGPAIYSRLARVKQAYDPGNMFRSARAIVPAPA